MPVEADVPRSKTVEMFPVGHLHLERRDAQAGSGPLPRGLLAVSDLDNGYNHLLTLDITHPIRAVSIRAGLGRACWPGCARAV